MASTPRTPLPRIPGSQWSYGTNTDEMTEKLSYSASFSSTNIVELDLPYCEPQSGTLIVRRHPRHGLDEIFRLERGQLPCSSYDGCSVMVRFDEKEAVTYSASPPEDNSTEILFIRNEQRFLTHLKAAKRLRVPPKIYQNGGLVINFDVTAVNLRKLSEPRFICRLPSSSPNRQVPDRGGLSA